MPQKDDEGLVVVSAASVRRAITGLESKTLPHPGADRKLTPEEQALIRIQLAEAMRAMDEESRGIDPQIMVSPRNGLASFIQSKIIEDGKGELVQLPSGRGYEIKFEEPNDWLGWGLSVFDWIHLKDHDQIPARTGEVHPMPDMARIAIVGDWGTGMYGAPITAKTIATLPEQYFMQLHLGDIYYSGTPKEVTNRFLKVWKKRPEALNRSLNGNHEMYSGGYGYFDHVLKSFEQPSSYFAHQNDNWLLVALDTAYIDHNLSDEQVTWLQDLVMSSGKRKVVLFSHHQPYSTLDGGGEDLRGRLNTLLSTGKIVAWYWGHEHRCIWYDPHPDWGLRGRCIGHGGIPYHRQPVATAPWVGGQTFGWRRLDGISGIPPCHVLDGPNTCVEERHHPEKFGPQGYVTLNFNGDQLEEAVFLPDGTPIALPM